MLDQPTANRLVKLLGLLGSDHDGEVAAAGRAAQRLLRNVGLTWGDVIAVESEPAPEAWREPTSWREAVIICLSLDDAPLNQWDRVFLGSISRRASLTEKQRTQLERIVETCRVHCRMAA